MANEDPIEKISADIEVYGVPQADGAPPMTVSYLHVRRRQNGAEGRAKMGLPAYKGEPGPAGPPGAIHQGERDSDELDALATVLDKQHTNWAYRNTDTNDQYVWSGETWVIYHGVYATPGPVGPAPVMTPGTLTIDGDEYTGPFGVRVSGEGGEYSVGVDLPPMPQGEKGDPGPSGPIYTSVDVDQSSTPADGAALVHNASSGKLEWAPTVYGIEEFAVPPSSFPDKSNISSGTPREEFFTLEIGARDYPYRFDFAGGVDVNAPYGYHLDVEIRQGHPETGRLVGIARDDASQGWHRLHFMPFSEQSFDPTTTGGGVVQPGTPVSLYVAAVRKQSGFQSWGLRPDFAQLRVRLMRLP